MGTRIQPAAVATFLAQSALFRGCSPTMLSQLAPHLEEAAYAAREQLAAPPTAPGALGLLHSGHASLRLSVGGAPIDALGPGDFLGEASVLLGAASASIATADETCVVLWVRKDHIEQILAAVPSVSVALAKRLAHRLARAGALTTRVEPVTPSGMMPAVATAASASASAAPPADAGRGVLRFVEIGSFQIGPQILEMIPSRLIQQLRCFPLELRGKTLVVGLVNPFALEARQELRRYLQSADPEIVAIGSDDWAQACVRHKVQVSPDKAGAVSASVGQRLAYQAEQRKQEEKQQIIIGEEVISLLDRVFVEALDRGASDLHIEPDVGSVRVRFRIQGMIVDRKEVVPPSFALPLIARVKVLAELDITERRLPQEGRIVAHLGRRELNMRVSTLPTVRGEKAVLRLLDAADVMRPFNQIFVDGQVAELAYQALSAAHGTLFVGGPSGGGKSTTLYSMLNQRKLLRPDNNIVTVEDPIEYPFPGLTQISVNAKAGLDYPTVLRSLLRQDPDVLVVGELREAASASLVLEAALTGHLVLTTVHGSSVLSVLQRLEHFGMSQTLVSQATNAIVVQRLARRLCPSCVREEEVAPALVESLAARGLAARGATLKLPRAVGCELCDKSGYLGRIAVVEVLSLQDEGLRAALASGEAPSEVLARAATQNLYLSMVRAAKLLMARKLLTPADALLAVSA